MSDARSGSFSDLHQQEKTGKEPQFLVPSSVVSKFDVEKVLAPQSVEGLIQDALQKEIFDKEEAFYVIDLSAVIRKQWQWKALLPRVHPFYAVKCNSSPAIVNTLASLGVNFDCASKAEIQQILGAGFSADRIIYANPTKMKSHIAYAKSSGVDLMTFDNSHELEKISVLFPEARLVLRIITDDSHSVCRFSTKFGAPLDQTQKLLEMAKELNLNVVGVSFHVGSGCMSTDSFCAAVKSAFTVFQQAEELGFHFSLLDLGGGWPGSDDDGISFTEIANNVRPLLDELFPSEIRVIAEPGRYFVAESHTLAVNIFAKRTVDEGEKRFLYYVNDGVYQSFNCILFDHYVAKPLVFASSELANRPLFKCTIFGPTCDSMDCIAKDAEFPEMHVGEWFYFKNMGAYTMAAASPFNGFKCPTCYFIQTPL